MGVNSCCTSCKLEGVSGSNGPQSCSFVDDSRGLDGGASEQAVKQLFETVKSLCAALATLTNNMKHMIETVGQSNSNPVNSTELEALRLTIREEVKEMVEREKWKSAIFWVQIKIYNCPILFVSAGSRSCTGPRVRMLRLGDF